jgi:hypothetical protein
MAVKYTVTEKGNPQKPEAPKKWYASFHQTIRVVSINDAYRF